MTIFSFQKNAGEKLFHEDDAPIQQRDKNDGQAILNYIASFDLPVDELTLKFDSAGAIVTVSGKAADQQTRERIILCCGNVDGVERVDEKIDVASSEAATSEWYTVKGEETLPDIAQKFYADAQKYWDIFAANEPMMVHPDRIYPGQMLRIPPGSRKCMEPPIVFRKNSFLAMNR